MSVKWITWAWEQQCTNAAEKLTLIALADHCGEDGSAYPGAGRLGEKTGSNERTVRRHIDRLEEAGLLTRERRRRRDGTLGTYLYQLVERPPDILTGGQSDLRSPSASPPDTAMSGGPPDTGVRAEPLDLLQPSEEPSDDLAGRAGVIALDPPFEAFYDAYPKKDHKGEARDAFKKLTRKQRAAAVEGAHRHARHIEAEPGVYVLPGPAVWLNKKRFEDETPLKRPTERPTVDSRSQLDRVRARMAGDRPRQDQEP